MCPSDIVLASWSLTQEVAGSSPFTAMRIIFVSEFTEFSENILEKLQYYTVVHLDKATEFNFFLVS